ncbi:hypothetical protein [Enterococcus devriesei]|uniref:hypothetical protein n=1 Tax=Enterococcus devriesei TaxID=319970 RepID=UPI0028EABDCB|nr:hypothetical protein [Enterococcus devriesei]
MRFQWLKDYQDLDNQILYMKWNLNKSKLELNRWIYGDLSDVRLNENSRSSSLEENVKKMEHELILLETQKTELMVLINSFEGLENEIVRLKYVKGYTLDQIAEKIGYSDSYIRKKHAEIRRTLQFMDDYEAQYIDRRNKQCELDYYNERREKRQQLSLF